MKVCGLKGLVCKKQQQQKQVRSQSQFLFLFLRLLLYFLSILHSVLKFTEALQSLNVATFRSGLSRMQPCLKLHLWMASDSFCVEWNQGEGLVKFLFNVWLSEDKKWLKCSSGTAGRGNIFQNFEQRLLWLHGQIQLSSFHSRCFGHTFPSRRRSAPGLACSMQEHIRGPTWWQTLSHTCCEVNIKK